MGPNEDASLDAQVDEEIDAALGCQTFAAHVDTCLLSVTSGDLNLDMNGTYVYDTDDGTLKDPDGELVEHESDIFAAAEGDLRALIADSLIISNDAKLEATGAMPLALLSFGDIDVAGRIDVSDGGAGSRSDCGVSTGIKGQNRKTGGGGGGGGAFQGAGGDGGEGDRDGKDQGAPGPGGVAASLPTSPLGGCAGGEGGKGEDPGGARGLGGGAIYLASASQIVISGSIQAGGEGGDGGDESGMGKADAGGGGGGSGGYILLEAPTIDLTGVIAANGGGGGEGSGDGDSGDNGQDGRLSVDAADGGSGDASTGGNGADGSSSTVLAGASVMAPARGGGGGGGGGAGFIIVLPSQTPGGTVSPPAL